LFFFLLPTGFLFPVEISTGNKNEPGGKKFRKKKNGNAVFGSYFQKAIKIALCGNAGTATTRKLIQKAIGK